MKNKRLILLLTLLIGIFTTVFYGAYNYYAPPKLREPYQLSTFDDDTIRIAYIGDSWAFMHKDHECLIPKLLSDTLHRPVKVHSFGICGLTSKEIYENIYNNTVFKHFLLKRKYHYCFISAGINDTYKKMSTIYYQKSMEGIIEFLLNNQIQPIILEIPDYDIQKCFESQKPSRKILRQLSMFINHTPIDCKQMFREALDELTNKKGYKNKVSIIKYKSWNNDYENDIKELYINDGMHLNNNGYTILDKIVTKEILRIANEHVL